MSKRNPIERIIIVNDPANPELFENTEEAKDAIYDIVTNNSHVAFASGIVVDGTLTITVL